MNNEPRLSKRESTSALRQPSSGRKRSGSIASTASRASLLFTSPAKHFGLTRKASTATLSVAPVSAVGSTLDHGLDPTSSEIYVSRNTSTAGGTDKTRPVRQATRAQDVLRSVQARAPQAPILQPESDLAPLSESPSSTPAPLPLIPNDPPADVTSSASSARTKSLRASQSRTLLKSKSTTLTSTPKPERSTAAPITVPAVTNNGPAVANNEATTPAAPSPSSSPPAVAKFRTPSMTPGFGPSRIPRKASMNSVRSYDPTTNKRPMTSSPLSVHTSAPTQTTTAASLTPGHLSAPDTGPTSSPSTVTATSSVSNLTPDMGQAPPSPAGSSWLTTLRGIARSPAPVRPTLPVSNGAEAPANTPVGVGSETSTATLNTGPTEVSTGAGTEEPAHLKPPQLTSRSSAGTLRPSQTLNEEGGVSAKEQPEVNREGGSAPVSSQTALVVGSIDNDVAGMPNGGDARGANTLRINTLAAQHSAGVGAGWTGHSPAGWIAWLTSTPASNAHILSPASPRRQIGMGEEDVMYIDSDSDGEGQTPVMLGRESGNGQEGDGEGDEMDIDAMTEDAGPTPAVTPAVVDSAFEERRAGMAGWSWGRGQDASRAGKGKEGDVGKGKTAEKRPGIGATAMRLDSIVSVLSEQEGDGEGDEVEGNGFGVL